jgi:hypothetical protein
MGMGCYLELPTNTAENIRRLSEALLGPWVEMPGMTFY